MLGQLYMKTWPHLAVTGKNAVQQRSYGNYCPTVQIDLNIDLKKNSEGFKNPRKGEKR